MYTELQHLALNRFYERKQVARPLPKSTSGGTPHDTPKVDRANCFLKIIHEELIRDSDSRESDDCNELFKSSFGSRVMELAVGPILQVEKRLQVGKKILLGPR